MAAVYIPIKVKKEEDMNPDQLCDKVMMISAYIDSVEWVRKRMTEEGMLTDYIHGPLNQLIDNLKAEQTHMEETRQILLDQEINRDIAVKQEQLLVWWRTAEALRDRIVKEFGANNSLAIDAGVFLNTVKRAYDEEEYLRDLLRHKLRAQPEEDSAC